MLMMLTTCAFVIQGTQLIVILCPSFILAKKDIVNSEGKGRCDALRYSTWMHWKSISQKLL